MILGGVLRDAASAAPQHERSLVRAGAEWFTATELAVMGLPGLPADKRSMNRRIADERWSLRHDSAGRALARPRAGRGGGLEFHVALLPAEARLAVLRDAPSTSPLRQAQGERDFAVAGSWRWYESQSDKTRAEAQRRLAAVNEIELLRQAGLTATAAIARVGEDHRVGKATLWIWLDMVKGVARHDRLPALAPRRQGGGREAEIDSELWEVFKGDYLRDSAPTLAICHAKCEALADLNGLSIPSQVTFRRKLEREVPASVILLARKGQEALRRSLPAQRRTVAEYHALELVNMDGHKFDVFVQPEGADPQGVVKPIRPILIGIQDVMSRKLLAWRIGTSETAWLTRLVFADLFAKFGIPKKAYLDNGRAFASKWITGGAKTRFRFKIGEDDPTGLLTGLGVETGFTLPYRGQSKPIERAWRELCDSISKSAAFDGAYTGNSTLTKPESYGRRAVPWAEFVDTVNRGIAFHNARQGRKTEMARSCSRGRSFDEVFATSYATAPIGKTASPEAMRMALLTAESVRINRQTGEIGLYGNRYWAPLCGELRGQKVTVRFDPGDLDRAVHLYDLKGRYLGEAGLMADTGFADVASAKNAARLTAEYRKSTRAVLDAERRMSAAEVAMIQRQIGAQDAPALPEPQIVRPHRHTGRIGGGQAAALKIDVAPEQRANAKREAGVFAALRLVGDDD